MDKKSKNMFRGRPAKNSLALAIATIVGIMQSNSFAEIPRQCPANSCRVGSNITIGRLPVLQGSALNDVEIQIEANQETIADIIYNGTDQSESTQLQIDQFTDKLLLNWESFNIGENNTVVFNQPDSNAVAVNRILDTLPSEIFGSLEANGQIYLFNPSGIIFGRDSQVNVSTLLASSLEVPDIDGTEGLDGDYERITQSGYLSYFLDTDVINPELGQQAAFVNHNDGEAPETISEVQGIFEGEAFKRGSIYVNEGAEIRSRDFGQVMLFGSEVVNAGLISTPSGQAILAAADDQIWIEPVGSQFIVHVKDGANVSNFGEILAERGSISLIGMALNQSGIVRATSSIELPGSIELRAEESSSVIESSPITLPAVAKTSDTGRVTFSSGSVTEVALEQGDETAIAAQPHNPSEISVKGHEILFEEGSALLAPNGTINVFADLDDELAGITDETVLPSITVEDNVTFDVSGTNTTVSADDLVAEVVLTGNELADFPVQKDGALRGQTISFDIRDAEQVTDVYGNVRYMLPFADVTGVINSIPLTLSQRASSGGTVNLNAGMGNVVLGENITVDVSAGFTEYESGVLRTSQLLDEFGGIVNVSDALPDVRYHGVVGSYTKESDKWGVTQQWRSSFGNTSIYEPGFIDYNEARGGTFQVVGTNGIDGINDLNIVSRVIPSQVNRENVFPGARLVIGDINGIDARTIGGDDELSLGAPNIIITDEDQTDENQEDDGENTIKVPADLYITREFIESNNISELSLSSNGAVVFEDGLDLNLPTRSQLIITAPAVEFRGDITAPSGTVEVNFVRENRNQVSTALVDTNRLLFENSSIDVSGLWTNDFIDGLKQPTSSIATDGGEINIRWNRGFEEASGTELVFVGENSFTADAGAWMDKNGIFHGGEGGDIFLQMSLQVDNNPQRVYASEDSELLVSAFGYTTGGSFSAEVDSFSIVETDEPNTTFNPVVAINDENIEAPDNLVIEGTSEQNVSESNFVFGTGFFENNGFSNIALTSGFNDIEISSGTNINVRQRNLVVDIAEASGVETGESLNARVELLDDYYRETSNLSLQINNDNNTDGLNIVLEEGASIELDPEAKLSLINNSATGGNTTVASGIFIGGEIVSHGGEVELVAKSEKNTTSEFVTDSLIWFGSNSVIDLSGTVVENPRLYSYPNAELIDGGEITINSLGGYVVMEEGAQFDISGTDAVITVSGGLPSSESSNAFSQLSTGSVSSNAGSIDIVVGEGAFLFGDINAQAGSETSRSGLFSVDISNGQRLDQEDGNIVGPNGEQRIVVSNQALAWFEGEDESVGESIGGGIDESVDELASETNSDPGDNVQDDALEGTSPSDDTDMLFSTSIIDDAFNGLVHIDTGLIEDGGFSRLSLETDQGRSIQFVSENEDQTVLELDVSESIVLQTGLLDIRSDTHINAPFVSIFEGRNDRDLAVAGESSLVISSAFEAGNGVGLIDLGRVRVAGVDEVILETSGDIRLQNDFVSSGRIVLDANQVYSSTRHETEFTLPAEFVARDIAETDSSDAVDATIQVVSNFPSSSPSPLYYAAGALGFTASDIFIDGTVRAPFGNLSFNASNSIEFGPNAFVSTSAHGDLIPYSPIIAGTLAAVYPEQPGIDVVAPEVEIADGATIDLSGGGDLLNWGFVRGPGGFNDILDENISPNSFAIIPGLQLAPENPRIENKFSVGQQVTFAEEVRLTNGETLAAGEYTVLPARYALLNDAYLVTREDRFSNLVVSAEAELFDGTPVVTGFMNIANTEVRDQFYAGYSVRTSDEVRNFSDYQEEYASVVQGNAYINNNDVWRPENASSLQISVESELSLAGNIIGGTGESDIPARGAYIGISADKLLIVDSDSEQNIDSDAGEVVLRDAELNNLEASSLLLGGRRTIEDGVTVIEAEATSLELSEGVEVEGAEILLTANDNISFDSASLVSHGNDNSVLNIETKAGNAFVGVSNRNVSSFSRQEGSASPSEQVQITIDDESTVQSEVSLILDSQSIVDVVDAEVYAESIRLGGENIVLGNAPEEFVGIALSSEKLERLSDAQFLQIRSAEQISFFGDLNILGEELTLVFDSSEIVNQDNSETRIQTNEFVLRNSGSQLGESTSPEEVDSNFIISTQVFSLLDGDVTFSGWESLDVDADLLLASGDSSLHLDQFGESRFELGSISARPAASAEIFAKNISFTTKEIESTIEPLLGLGGSLSVDAESLEFDVAVRLASGNISLTSRENDLVLGENASLDVSGINKQFYNLSDDTWGGQVSLSSGLGNINILEGASINLAGSGSEIAGQIFIDAVEGSTQIAGELIGSASQNSKGASIYIDTQSLQDDEGNDLFNELNQNLNENGFNANRQFRVREGDITVENNTTIVSDNIRISVDQGDFNLEGALDASGQTGGSIDVNAGENIRLGSSARISAAGTEGVGGTVLLSSYSGYQTPLDGEPSAGIILDNNSVIDVSGPESGGSIRLRAKRNAATGLLGEEDAGNNDLNIWIVSEGDSGLSEIVQGQDSLVVEGFTVYEQTNNQFENVDYISLPGAQDIFFQDMNGDGAFNLADGDIDLSAAPPFLITIRCTDANPACLTVTANVEGELTSGSQWDAYFSDAIAFVGQQYTDDDGEFVLSREEFIASRLGLNEIANAQLAPGIELQSSQDFTFDTADVVSFSDLPLAVPGSLVVRSEGDLDIEQSIITDFAASDSWNYSFTAGADTSSAPWATGQQGGDLNIAENVKVLTGTGDISLFAGQDVNLRGAVKSIGKESNVSIAQGFQTPTVIAQDSGDIIVEAARNVNGNANSGTVNPFLLDGIIVEEGSASITEGSLTLNDVENVRALIYSSPDETPFNIESSAGGNIQVSAKGDINELTARTFSASTVVGDSISDRFGKGNLRIKTDGNLNSSQIAVGDGEANIYVAGKVDTSFNYQVSGSPAYSLFGTQGGAINIRAAGDVKTSGVINTTFPYALSYKNDTSVSIDSLGGDVSFLTESLNEDDYDLLAISAAQINSWFPGTITSTAFGGSIDLAKMMLSTSPQGSFQFLADENFSLTGTGALLGMSELDLDEIPIYTDTTVGNNLLGYSNAVGRFGPTPPNNSSPSGDVQIRVRELEPVHSENPNSSAIVALNGSYFGDSGGKNLDNVFVPTNLLLYAGENLIEPKLNITHAQNSAISQIIAQGNIDDAQINVSGPGRLDVAAGGNLTFVTDDASARSSGITSLGGTADTRLFGQGGADINVYVGVVPDSLAWDSFINDYLTTGDRWDGFVADLRVFVEEVSQDIAVVELESVTEISDYEVLQRYLSIPESQRSSFESDTFSNQEELSALINGLAYSLEIASKISTSNSSTILQSLFDNTLNTGEPFVASGVAIEDLFIDSIRVFSNPDYYTDYYDSLGTQEPNTLTMQHIAERVAATGADSIDARDKIKKFFDIIPGVDQTQIIERSYLLLDESTQRQLALNLYQDFLDPISRQELVMDAFFGQLRDSGRLSNQIGDAGYDFGFEAIDRLFPEVTYSGDKEINSNYAGNLSMDLRRIYTFDGGDINLLAPGGIVNAGNPSLVNSGRADEIGVVAVRSGDVRAYTHENFLVNQSRVQTRGGGNILMWSSDGDLDAGRGARTALSAPAPEFSIDESGNIFVNFGAGISGSGIRQVDVISTQVSFDTDPNNVKPPVGIDLVAPNGAVDAGEAGIFASGNLNIAASRIVNAEFIEFGGVAVGIPTDTGGLSASLTGVSDLAASATNAVADKATEDANANEDPLSWLEVSILGFGDEEEE